MKVELIAITKSLIEGVEMSAEELLVYEARVSNPSNQLNTETSDKLIGYMIKNGHLSPFDMINMTVGVTTSRAIAHQILRHWSIKPQEFSQRYAEATSYEPIQFRFAGKTNRQSSSEEICTIDFDKREISHKGGCSDLELIQFCSEVRDHIYKSDELYKKAIKLGIAKECARMILPLTTSTTMYLNGSIRSWIFYLKQRTDSHAQLEHKQVALLIEEIFKQNFPMTFKALENLKNENNERLS